MWHNKLKMHLGIRYNRKGESGITVEGNKPLANPELYKPNLTYHILT